MLGQSFVGKSTLAAYCGKNLDMCVIDLKAINEDCKKALGTEEEPFEGELAPIEKIEAEACAMIAAKKGKRTKFLFDGYNVCYKQPADFCKFLEQFGLPEFILDLSAST